MKIPFLLFALLLLFFSCRKESFTNSPDALLRIGTDTLHYDTVFTTTGSITQSFKIFNDNAKGIHINSVELKGGALSPFKVNVNGIPGPLVNNSDVRGDDSIYVFVSVSINPSLANLPFIIRDSIEVNYNGNKKIVQLEAYGQNAHFLRNKSITSSEVWTNDLPYVVLGNLEIAPNAKLTINEGCKIYLHADAPFIVRGSLVVLGKKWDSTRVSFAGDRLDEPYKNYPASWPGIYFTATSKDNVFNYAVIKNAYQALVVQSPSTNNNPKLVLNETIIDNAYDAGVLAVNSSIKAQNLLVSNSGRNIMLVSGGDYDFKHCTSVSISNNLVAHKDPVLFISNYFNQAPPNSLNAIFQNCIFWGEGGQVDNEVVVTKNGGNTFNVQIDHALIKAKENPTSTTLTSIILNQPPEFDTVNASRGLYNFHLRENSPALNKGKATAVTLDLDGNSRPRGIPDLGCYERQP